MLSREEFETQILDYTYGLLDPPAVAAFEAYLQAHPEARAELERAQQFQKLVAKAAKSEFPETRFVAPSTPAKSSNTAAVVSAGSSSRASANSRIAVTNWDWRPYALAASVLVLVGGLIFPTYRHLRAVQHQERIVADHQAKFEEVEKRHEQMIRQQRNANQEMTDAMAEQEKLLAQWDKAWEEMQDALQNRQFAVRLEGPENLQAGAVSEFKISTYNLQGTPTPVSKLRAVLRDQNDPEKVLLRQDLTQVRGPAVLRIPADLPITPESQLALEVFAIDEHNAESRLTQPLPLNRPVYVTFLSSDKPMYAPGDTIYFRSVTLDKATFRPASGDLQLKYSLFAPGSDNDLLQLTGNARLQREENGQIKPVLGPDGKPLQGVGAGAYKLPNTVAGGEYTLVVSRILTQADGTVVEEKLASRKLNVINYQRDRLNKKLEFDGKSYGPGDVVMARVDVSRAEAEGNVGLAHAPIKVTARVDGEPIQNILAPNRTDANGTAYIRFTLPRSIKYGDGTLDVAISDGDNNTDVETISRPIPIIAKRLDIQFYPEGGELVDGLPTRVYFQVRIPPPPSRAKEPGKPADLRGKLLADGTPIVENIFTLTDPDQPGANQGQGVFEFTPRLGVKYQLAIDKPIGIEGEFVLPPVKPTGVALRVPTGISGAKPNDQGFTPLVVKIQHRSTPPAWSLAKFLGWSSAQPAEPVKKSFYVGAYCRGRLLVHDRIHNLPEGTEGTLTLPSDSPWGGVVRVTVFEVDESKAQPELKPVAERLVYRRGSQELRFDVRPDKSRYSPGDSVAIDVDTLTESGEATPAVLMMAVVNQSIITQRDDKTMRLMPTHFLIAGEVQHPEDLEHADFFLTDHPKAPIALDLLLGTQGWRRFVEVHPHKLKNNTSTPAEVRSLLVRNGQQARMPIETVRLEEERLTNEFLPKFEQVNQRISDAIAAVTQTHSQPYLQERQAIEQERRNRFLEYEAASTQLAALLNQRALVKKWAIPAVGILLVTVALGCLVIAVRRGVQGATPYYVTSAGAFAACMLLLVTSMMNILRDDQALVVRDSFPAYGMDFFDDAGNVFLQNEALPAMNLEMQPIGPGGGPAEKMPEADGALGNRMGVAPAAGPGRVVDDHLAVPAPPGGPMPPMKAAPRRMNAPMREAGLPMEMQRKAIEREAKLTENHNAKKQDKGFADAKVKQQPDVDAPHLAKLRDMQNEQFKPQQPLLNQLRARLLMMRAKGESAFAERAEPLPPAPFGKPAPAVDRLPIPGLNALDPVEKKQLARQKLIESIDRTQQAFVVREYAHSRAGRSADSIRNDFTDTLLWQPALVVPESGHVQVAFDLSDSVTRYQVLVAGHTLDGRIGTKVTEISVSKPFYLEPRLPNEISSSDRIDMPLRIVNNSDVARKVNYTLETQSLTVQPPTTSRTETTSTKSEWKDGIELTSGERTSRIYRLTPTIGEGIATLKLQSQTNAGSPNDAVERTLRIQRDGFPVSGSVSDTLEGKATVRLHLPDFKDGSLKVTLNVYPSTLADLQQGLEGLLREPHGCFEQTSTTNYPNVMILDYLRTSDQARPETSRRAKELLERGYQRLTSFECLKPEGGRQGYEWFGGTAPPHEALTAYGLMQFRDMAKVMPKGTVDEQMIQRTQQYLLGQRDGKGGFKRNPRAIDNFGAAPPHLTNAYIVWSLTESDPDNLAKLDLSVEIAALKQAAKTANDPYYLALIANALLNHGDRTEALQCLDAIAQMQTPGGAVVGAETSITRSSGRALDVETTALATLGWFKAKDPRYRVNLYGDPKTNQAGSIKWISRQRSGRGDFGSTQSTILALKALIAYTQEVRRPAEAGTVRLYVAGQEIDKVDFTEETRDVITLEVKDPAKVFQRGTNEVQVEITTKQPYPFSLGWSCYVERPENNDKSAVRLTTKLAKTNLTQGESVDVEVTLENVTDQGHGMAVAIIGLPAGLRLSEDLAALKKLRDEDRISFFEIMPGRDRELVLYWRSLQPKQKIALRVPVIADVPGLYHGPASRAYLYYNPDHKHWVDALKVEIQPGGLVEASTRK